MKKVTYSVILAVGLLLLYLPILVLAFFSFTNSTTIGAVRDFSFHNYITLFTTEELRNMIIGTLSLAVLSALLATILGTLGAIGAFYSGRRSKSFMHTINQIPVVNADVVTGFSLCILLIIVMGVDKDSYIPLIVGHTVLSTPFVYLSVLPRLKSMDSYYYEAALDLGATPFQALFKVIIPAVSSGIVSGFFLAITLSLDDYFVATYTKPAAFDTISTYVVNATKGGQTDIKTALWALSTLIFVIVVLVTFAANRPSKKEVNENA
ncbi:MAG: ABC transporter permease subunit [Lachnospiraceae bacterium]|nr:ABC transporter permease subunit [Lachnospiraceae bacterium]